MMAGPDPIREPVVRPFGGHPTLVVRAATRLTPPDLPEAIMKSFGVLYG